MENKEIYYYKSDIIPDYNFEDIKNKFISTKNSSNKIVFSNITTKFPKDDNENLFSNILIFTEKIYKIVSNNNFIVCIERNEDNFQGILIFYGLISNQIILKNKIDISDCPKMIAFCGDEWITINPEYPLDVVVRKLMYVYSKEADKCHICLENIESSTPNIKCGHIFHRECLINSIKDSEKSRCPLCREDIEIKVKNNELISIRPKDKIKILKIDKL